MGQRMADVCMCVWCVCILHAWCPEDLKRARNGVFHLSLPRALGTQAYINLSTLKPGLKPQAPLLTGSEVLLESPNLSVPFCPLSDGAVMKTT